MALGKNLKKKKLIPDKPEKKKVSKPSPKVKKKRLISKEKIAPKKKQVAHKKAPEKLVNFITTEKHELRTSLRRKFDLEINELADKFIQLVVFKLGIEEYAIEISKVKEVVSTPEISKVPKMPDYVRGLTDIRGKTVLIIDIALKFALLTPTEGTYTLVVKSKDQPVGLILNDLPLALKVDGNNISSPMSYLVETSLDDIYVKGIIKLEERLIYYLDVDQLLAGDKAIVVPNHLA
ncbi:MAG: purine-binding chemotaxis protein CheW [Cytophagales bacterium]|nr:purine-binding chemotaxis protein CheW [Cytophagales bacterium]